MYASDYAHWDCEFPNSVRMLSRIEGLEPELRAMVLGQNAIRWFGLRAEDLPTSSVAGHVLAVS
jgi:hypothetical protein